MVLDQKKKQNVIDYFQAKNGYKREDSRLKIGKKLAAEERQKKGPLLYYHLMSDWTKR